MLEIAGETFEETFEERSGEPRGKELVKNWGEEKMNWRGGRGNLNASFTDGYKINYYFNLFRRWGVKNPSVNFEFRTKFFNDPPEFSWFVGNMTRSEMHLMYNPLKFARSVRNFVGKIRRYGRQWMWHFK
jgi:hypothetical protein